MGVSIRRVRSSYWRSATTAINDGAYDLVVLYEITYPLNWRWIELEELIEVIRKRPRHVNLIATGRQAPGELIEIADTVTEMVKVKHVFDRGIRARRGIDF